MLWTPQKGTPKIITNLGIVGSSTPGTSVPANATTLLDGAVTELISAANNVQDSWGIEIAIAGLSSSTNASESCIDILIGGATDDVLIAALICGGAQDARFMGTRSYFFPVHIPGGVRIAAQLASVIGGSAARVVVSLLGGSPPPFRIGRKVTTYGTQINNVRGVAVTPTASGGAASVTEIVASTSEDHFAFLPGFQVATDASTSLLGYNVGIGIGAATEERIGTWLFGSNASEDFLGPFPRMPAFRDVPSGTRLSLLVSNSGTNDAAYDGLIYAVS